MIFHRFNLFQSITRIGQVCLLLIALFFNHASLAEESPQAININQASAEVIADTLSGIGLKKAQAIVAWREDHGKFTHKEQLTAIKGIGESTLSKNESLIRLK